MLFNPEELGHRPSAGKLRYDLICKRFGIATQTDTLPGLADIQQAATSLPPAYRQEWQRAVAEELLLRHNSGKPIPSDWLAAFSDTYPFDGAKSPLGDLLNAPAACCMFPLATDRPSPGAGHAWVFASGQAEFIATVPRSEWHGDSWQLAAALARRALDSGAPDIIQKLATDWIATGTCDDDRIGPVELGNKPEKNTRGQIFRAATIQSAFNIVTGQGYQRVEAQQIPCSVDVLHSFVSDARLPLLLAALATQPKTIKLWYSETFKTLAGEIRQDLIPAFLPGCVMAKPQVISSSNLAEIETTLRNALVKENGISQSIVFSVTNGNLIQRLAAASVATSFPQMQLVYRDLDTTSTNLTTISYQTFPPTTCYNASTSIAPGTVNIAFLTGRDENKITTNELITRLQPEK